MIKHVVLFFLLIGTCQAFDGYTRGELRDEVRQLMLDNPKDRSGNNDTARQRYTDAQLNRRLELAQVDIVKNTRCLQYTTYYMTYSGTATYSLPSDYLSMNRVAFKNSLVNGATIYIKCTRFSYKGLDSGPQGNETWMQESASRPKKYIIWGNDITFIPAPAAAYAGANSLLMQYIVNPSTFTSDSAKPFNNQKYLYPYHDLLVYFVCEQCKTDEKLLNDASYFANKYNTGVTLMRTLLQTLDDYDPSFGGQ